MAISTSVTVGLLFAGTMDFGRVVAGSVFGRSAIGYSPEPNITMGMVGVGDPASGSIVHRKSLRLGSSRNGRIRYHCAPMGVGLEHPRWHGRTFMGIDQSSYDFCGGSFRHVAGHRRSARPVSQINGFALWLRRILAATRVTCMASVAVNVSTTSRAFSSASCCSTAALDMMETCRCEF